MKKKENPALAALAAQMKIKPIVTVTDQPVPKIEPQIESPIEPPIETPAEEFPALPQSAPQPALTAETIRGLIRVDQDFSQHIGQIVQVPVARLRVADNARIDVARNEEFKAFVESIRSNGVLQNLLVQVRTDATGAEDLVIISGQRRWEASKEAGKETVPCLLQQQADTKTSLFYSLIENLQREDLSPVDIGLAYAKLIELGATQQSLAAAFGVNRKTIGRYVGLASWPPEALKIIRENQKLFSTDFLFNKLPNDTIKHPDLLIARLRKEVDVAQKATEDGYPLDSAKGAARTTNPFVHHCTGSLRQRLGVPVQITGSEENLRITIKCQGNDNVARVLKLLGILEGDAGSSIQQ